MPTQAQPDLFGEIRRAGRPVNVEALEQWMEAEASAWLDGYRFLRAQGVRHRYALLAVWLSVSGDDRGDIKTRGDLADLMAVSRATTYGWEAKQPVQKWAELLRLRRMCGARLAEVDERTYGKAIDEESSASDRKLYYQRAGVWEDERRLHLVGAEEGPVAYTDVSDGEIEAIRQALIAQAEGGGEEG